MPLLSSKAAMAGTLTTALLASLWYSTSMLATTTAKLAMQSAQVPLLLCCVQFFSATVITRVAAHAQGVRLGPLGRERRLLGLVSLGFTLGFLCTNWALALSHAPFVETVKACEPISTVVLAYFLLGEVQALGTYASLLLVAGGVALASTGKAAGNSAALLLAMGANCNFSVRAVVAKRLKRDYPESAAAESDVGLFHHVSLIGLLLLLPPMLLVFAVNTELPLLREVLEEGLVRPERLAGTALLNGAMYTSYNLFSLMVLSRVSAATHSLLNVCRRVCVICVTALFFGVELSAVNVGGVVVAVVGMCCFTLSKSRQAARSSAAVRRWRQLLLRLAEAKEGALSLREGAGPECRVEVERGPGKAEALSPATGDSGATESEGEEANEAAPLCGKDY